MKTNSAKKLANLVATVTAAPAQTASHNAFTEAQMFVQLGDGRTVKIYSFNKVAHAAVNNISEHNRLVIFGNFMASDAFKMTGWKLI